MLIRDEGLKNESKRILTKLVMAYKKRKRNVLFCYGPQKNSKYLLFFLDPFVDVVPRT